MKLGAKTISTKEVTEEVFFIFIPSYSLPCEIIVGLSATGFLKVLFFLEMSVSWEVLWGIIIIWLQKCDPKSLKYGIDRTFYG